MSAKASDLLGFQEDVHFKVSDSPKHIAAVLSDQQKKSGLSPYSEVRFFVVVIDANNNVLLPIQFSQTLKDHKKSHLSVFDLPGIDISLLDAPEQKVSSNSDADASINSWTYAVVTAELGNKQVYGGLELLYANGTHSVCGEQAVVVVVACWVRDKTFREHSYITMNCLMEMDWLEMDIGDAGRKEVLRRLDLVIESKHRRPAKSDVRTTFDGRSYYMRKPVASLLAIEAAVEPKYSSSMVRLARSSLPAVSLKVNGVRCVRRKHFARSQPATEYRERLLKREQTRNGERHVVEVKTRQLVLEGLQVDLEDANSEDLSDWEEHSGEEGLDVDDVD